MGKFLKDDDEEDPDPPMKIIGVVENMSFFSPTDMPDKKYYRANSSYSGWDWKPG